MSEADTEQDKIEGLMKQACLAGPSKVLKARVAAVARNAWNRDRSDVPVRIVLRRLVASAAAAVILVVLADGYGNHSVSPWQSGTVTAAERAPLNLEGLPASPRPVFVQHLRLQSRPSSIVDADVLREHIERVREILDESQQHGGAESAAPAGGRSRLIPLRPGFDTVS